MWLSKSLWWLSDFVAIVFCSRGVVDFFNYFYYVLWFLVHFSFSRLGCCRGVLWSGVQDLILLFCHGLLWTGHKTWAGYCGVLPASFGTIVVLFYLVPSFELLGRLLLGYYLVWNCFFVVVVPLPVGCCWIWGVKVLLAIYFSSALFFCSCSVCLLLRWTHLLSASNLLVRITLIVLFNLNFS